MSSTVEARLWPKVEKSDGCWTWTGSTAAGGYGRLYVDGHLKPTHRIVYELLVGPIPEGLELDHLCRNIGCVNPDHLEPVTHAENIRRAYEGVTHCQRGHLFDEENTYTRKDGRRECRACHRVSLRKLDAKRKAQRALRAALEEKP